MYVNLNVNQRHSKLFFVKYLHVVNAVMNYNCLVDTHLPRQTLVPSSIELYWLYLTKSEVSVEFTIYNWKQYQNDQPANSARDFLKWSTNNEHRQIIALSGTSHSLNPPLKEIHDYFYFEF